MCCKGSSVSNESISIPTVRVNVPVLVLRFTMDDYDEEKDDRTIRSVEVSIAGEDTASTAYLLKLSLHQYGGTRHSAKEVKADLVVPGTNGKPDELVGLLEGNLLRRPDPNFFEAADEISQELQELSVTFCNSKGVANRIKHQV